MSQYAGFNFEKVFGEEYTYKASNLNNQQIAAYQKSLLSYLDLVNVMDTKLEEGKMIGKKEIVLTCLKERMELSLISRLTGFSSAEIEEIKKSI